MSAGALEFRIAPDHPALPGHFPGAPVVPGVVLLERVLEAIAQAGGATAPLRLPQVKFMHPLLPGETAQVRLDPCDPSTGGARRWRFRVLRGETVLATGEVWAG